jgi:hypothetical protein
MLRSKTVEPTVMESDDRESDDRDIVCVWAAYTAIAHGNAAINSARWDIFCRASNRGVAGRPAVAVGAVGVSPSLGGADAISTPILASVPPQ